MQGPQPPTWPAQTYPPPPPYGYYPVPPRGDGSKIILIVVIVVVAFVVGTVVLSAILYLMVSGLVTGPPPSPTMGVAVSQAGPNWTVTVVSTPPGLFPATTTLLIRDPQGVISLARMPWASLVFSANQAEYADGNPGVAEIRPGDGLLIDRATYPAGSFIEISGENGVVLAAIGLQ